MSIKGLKKAINKTPLEVDLFFYYIKLEDSYQLKFVTAYIHKNDG